jgi:hypothetical protein
MVVSFKRWMWRTALAVVAATGVPAHAEPIPEYTLKAAFVYNFALFTDWPQSASGEAGPLQLCFSADSVLRPALSDLNDRLVKGRRIIARAVTNFDAIRHCHLLFLDGGDRVRWSAARNGLRSAPVLTISDDPEIIRTGALIALYFDNDRIAFDINMPAVREAQLTLSSKLLRLARAMQ